MKRLLTLLALSYALALTATAQLRQEFQDIDVNQLRKLQMVHVAVTELYVDTVNQGKLTEAAIRGILKLFGRQRDEGDQRTPAGQLRGDRRAV